MLSAADNAGTSGQPSTVVIDASKPPSEPAPLPFPMGGRSPAGHVLSINSRYLTLDGRPWFPVMGEFHFSRYPAAEWEREIRKMKAGGVRIVSAYIFWIHHEEIEGQFDWSGRRDLRRFVELCAANGMYVWIRVGPWAHGEVRNGGFPDWLIEKVAVRRNDPAYLRYVAGFFGEIGKQVKGLFWKDGGPIAGVQIENEYHAYGPGEGTEHILTLKRLALEAGLDAPFYTITGWDNAVIPDRGVVPVFGGYADQFWARGLEDLPPNPNYFFTPIRCEENVGDDLRSRRPEIDARFAAYPFFTAEMGGGMQPAYHRRPLITADDTAAMALVKLGAGVTLYGYYMFHGGTNPEGKRTTLMESQVTAYPQDLPVKSYDFQAPLGEYGQMRDSFRDLKTLHLFLSDFGPEFAPLTTAFPERQPAGKQDTGTPRAAARTNGRSGFIFLNNYQRIHPLPARKDFQVKVKLASATLEVPRRAVEVPAGAFTFWPVNLDIQGATLEYATAQPLAKLKDPATYVFFAWPGIAPEFAFLASDGLAIEAPHARVRREEGRVYIDRIAPGAGTAIELRRSGKSMVRILVLSRDQARNSWKATLVGRDRLILSVAGLFFEGGNIHVLSTDPTRLVFAAYPAIEGGVKGFSRSGEEGIFERYSAQVQPISIRVEVEKLAEAGPRALVRMGSEVALAPVDADFAHAARWRIRVPGLPSNNVYLRIPYQGDIARLYDRATLVADDFQNGRVWEVGLWRLAPDALARGIELKILPLPPNAPIYLQGSVRAGAAAVADIRAIPEYEAVGTPR